MPENQYLKLKEEILAETKAAFQEMLNEAVNEMTKCAAQAIQPVKHGHADESPCKDKCGLSPNEHYEAHRKVNEFFNDLSDITKTVRGTIIKLLITIGVLAAALGLGLEVKRYLP
jgi:hypothetical protein